MGVGKWQCAKDREYSNLSGRKHIHVLKMQMRSCGQPLKDLFNQPTECELYFLHHGRAS